MNACFQSDIQVLLYFEHLLLQKLESYHSQMLLTAQVQGIKKLRYWRKCRILLFCIIFFFTEGHKCHHMLSCLLVYNLHDLTVLETGLDIDVHYADFL